MHGVFELSGVVKRFGERVGLDGITLGADGAGILGLVGRNGSGKSTLLRSVAGLYLPDTGSCRTFGRATRDLGPGELQRLGFVDQHARLVDWMRGAQLLRYVSRFYPRWDAALESHLVAALELDLTQRIWRMTPGNRQKLALVTAVCHRPTLLLLDEPLSDLDPLARRAVLELLLERFNSDAMTIVISSHMLRDIEAVVDRLVCMDYGRVTADDDMETLRERYAEWLVTSASGDLPTDWPEDYVLDARGAGHRAVLQVVDGDVAAFSARYGATVEVRPLNLERIFPLLVAPVRPAVSDSTFRDTAGVAEARP
ncbi:MAG TPA: ABC transporter ATP-binding protein [Longimicrobiales bacterium]|nr:ABC transporter ATP-binding protein [Longimicrobiales bacterium]